MLQGILKHRGFGLFWVFVLILCSFLFARVAFFDPKSEAAPLPPEISKEQNAQNIAELPQAEVEIYGPPHVKITQEPALAQVDEPQQPAYSMKEMRVSDIKDNSDILETCADLLKNGVVCMFVPPQQDHYSGASYPDYDSVMQQHHRHRDREKARFAERENMDALTSFNSIMPASGLYGGYNHSQSTPFDGDGLEFQENPDLSARDDTVSQAAMRAAYEMVNSRYTDAVYQAQQNGGEVLLDSEDALSLTQDALSSAAERAFETFIRDNFGKRNFDGRSYDGMRSYFVSAFKHATATSVKSIGRRFVSDVTAGGGFKNVSIRSELLKNLDNDIATAFIDTGLAAAKNSQYAFLRNLEVSYRIRENEKPEYSLLTVQPLHSSADKRHNLFLQAALSYQGSRQGYTGGLGYRYMPDSENYVVGSNVFLDYQRPYNHLRASAGLDVQSSLLGASANYYKGLSDWRNARTGFEERALDGFDLELSGRMPFLPALEVFGRGYRWQALEEAKDINGTELRVEYSPVPAFTVEAMLSDEDQNETSFGLGLRYNYTFGAPADYLYDWNEQFRQKSPAEYVFRKARRDNNIRVQERVDLDASEDINTPIGPAIIASAPVDGAADVSVGTDVTLTFAEDVLAGVGDLIFTDLSDASDNFTIPVGDPRISIVNNIVSVDLSARLLDFNSNYDITFASGVFTDVAGVDSPAVASGDFDFTTVVDPTAGFPTATATLAANTTNAAFTPRNTTATWQTTINIVAAPNGVIFETGATGRGVGAWFHLNNLQFAVGAGGVSTTGSGAIFGTFPTASIPEGLHHFVFVAKPDAAAEIAVYMDGIRIITESTAAALEASEWAGTDGAGYGLSSGSIRAGGNSAAITNATLTNNLSFFSGQQPASF